MPYKIEIVQSAGEEIIEAFDWYESRQEGLGTEFLEDLELFYKQIKKNPKIFSYLDFPVRDGKLKRFPYCIAYEEFSSLKVLVIYSVFMTSQDPIKRRKSI